jgi:hypothetical protein
MRSYRSVPPPAPTPQPRRQRGRGRRGRGRGSQRVPRAVTSTHSPASSTSSSASATLIDIEKTVQTSPPTVIGVETSPQRHGTQGRQLPSRAVNIMDDDRSEPDLAHLPSLSPDGRLSPPPSTTLIDSTQLISVIDSVIAPEEDLKNLIDFSPTPVSSCYYSAHSEAHSPKSETSLLIEQFEVNMPNKNSSNAKSFMSMKDLEELFSSGASAEWSEADEVQTHTKPMRTPESPIAVVTTRNENNRPAKSSVWKLPDALIEKADFGWEWSPPKTHRVAEPMTSEVTVSNSLVLFAGETQSDAEQFHLQELVKMSLSTTAMKKYGYVVHQLSKAEITTRKRCVACKKGETPVSHSIDKSNKISHWKQGPGPKLHRSRSLPRWSSGTVSLL